MYNVMRAVSWAIVAVGLCLIVASLSGCGDDPPTGPLVDQPQVLEPSGDEIQGMLCRGLGWCGTVVHLEQGEPPVGANLTPVDAVIGQGSAKYGCDPYDLYCWYDRVRYRWVCEFPECPDYPLVP